MTQCIAIRVELLLNLRSGLFSSIFQSFLFFSSRPQMTRGRNNWKTGEDLRRDLMKESLARKFSSSRVLCAQNLARLRKTKLVRLKTTDSHPTRFDPLLENTESDHSCKEKRIFFLKFREYISLFSFLFFLRLL